MGLSVSFETENYVLKMGNKLIQRGQFQFFSWSMDAAEGGAEGNHVKVRELLKEKTALKACVDGFYLRLCIEQPAVALY